MLKLCGILLLLCGSTGLGWTLKEAQKTRLEELYRLQEILRMLQNEITYSRTSIPEACRRIGERAKEPYRSALLGIHEEIVRNRGEAFDRIWKKQMENCLGQIRISGEDRKLLLDFGGCIGHMDGEMQAELIAGYMHRLSISADRMEKEISSRCKVIMSLSVMGGFMAAIILI